jgi:hypothetical protein
VADGRSNREIAETPGVSEKTVINDVTAVFNRLGVDNRAAATAFAFRHQLVSDTTARRSRRPAIGHGKRAWPTG